MTGAPQKRPAPGGHRGTGQNKHQHKPQGYSASRSRAKRLIVAAGARGFLPPRLADALIRWGGLRHA
jgi:hypothetical protein